MSDRGLFRAWAIVLTLAGVAAGAVRAAPSGRREVLPDTVVPSHYDLLIAPDARALTFQGKVTIAVEVAAPTRDVVLNAEGLAFDRAALDGEAAAAMNADPKLGRETLRFGAPIAAGRHTLAIDYHGKIGRSTLGFFAMDHAGPKGSSRTLATNFEPAAARQFLPCWDEPGRKASFTITVDAPAGETAISNMPIATVTPLSPTLRRVRFAPSPRMATYLLFLGIGDFERIHRMVDGVDVGIVVKRGDTAKAAYALDQAARLLRFYNGYFGVPYPLPKLDLIAAPGEISGGSMENWGAIFYSQNHLLFDPASSTEEDRRLVFLVVAHEMAHQWFGDLVTMAWWDDLWLNEGFARWMQTFAADALHPEWETGLRAQSIFESGKQADAIPSTHPVVQTVLTADQAGQAFDAITYNKGAAIITMLQAYVGPERFGDGVRRYMRAHAFGSTVDADLWSAVQAASGKPILKIEQDVTRQEGVPMVRVAAAGTRTFLSEGRFAADPSTLARAPRQAWTLPILVKSPAGQGEATVLLEGEASLTIPPPAIVNAGQTTYARVLYPPGALAALVARMGELSAVDQLGLINDGLALGLAGDAPAGDVLALASALRADADPIVWQRVVDILVSLDLRYADTPGRAAFRRFARRLLAPLAAGLGPVSVAGETGAVEILRAAVVEALGGFGDPDVLARARKALAEGGGSATERRTALDVVAGQADPAAFDALLARAAATSDPLEKLHVFTALAKVRDPALAKRMMRIAFTAEVPAGAAPSLLSLLIKVHPDLAWEAVLPRLTDPALPLEDLQRWNLVVEMAGASALPERIAGVQAYEAAHVPAAARRPFAGAIASIRNNRRIVDQTLPRLDVWISSHGTSAPT